MKLLKKWGVVIALIGSMIATSVDAASFTLNVTPTQVTVEPGETVTVQIAVSDIDIANGINAVEGFLEYDKNVLEPVAEESFSSQSNWSTTYNGVEDNSLYGKFLIFTLSEGEVSDQNIATLTLQVKETATRGTSTQVKLKELTTNDGANLISETDKVITINIKSEEIIPEPEPEPEEPNISPEPIPQTGENFIVPAVVVALGAIGIVAYVKIHNYRKI